MREVAEALSIKPRTVAFHKYRTMNSASKQTAEFMPFAVKKRIVKT